MKVKEGLILPSWRKIWTLNKTYVKLIYAQESSLPLKPEKDISKYYLKYLSQLKRMIIGLPMAEEPVTKGKCR